MLSRMKGLIETVQDITLYHVYHGLFGLLWLLRLRLCEF